MKRNIALTVATLALAGLCCAISLITVRTAAPALLTSHAIALAVGVVLLAVIVTMGPTRLSLAGLMISLCVVGLCLCCFIEESDYGLHHNLVMFGRETLSPAFFLSPSLILLYAWARRNHRGTLFFAEATISVLLLAALMPRLSEATIILFLAAALYGFVVRIPNHKAIRCLIAAAITFSPLVVREVQMQMSGRSWFGPGSLIGDYTDFSWYMVANSPWIRTSELSRTPPPIGCIDSNVLGFASYYCGNWTLVVLAVAFAFLSVCLVIIARRARTSTQKILATSGAIALITQTVLGILHFFFLIPRHASFVPFVSTGKCYTVACFALLGLVLASLRKDSAATEKVKNRHRIDICVCGAILGAIATVGAMLLMHKELLPETKIARMMPEGEQGHFFNVMNGILTNDIAIVPMKRVTGIGEPSIVVALVAFRNGDQIWKEDINREPPIVAAQCRIRPDGRIALDCRDLYEDEFTLVFDPPTRKCSESESSATDERWKIFIDPQGHLGCTNLWTDARVAQALSRKLNLDYCLVSNALSRTDSRYIKLKITSDSDEIACAKRNRRFWRLVIEKEPSAAKLREEKILKVKTDRKDKSHE